MNKNDLECLAAVGMLIGRELQQIDSEHRRYAVARLERLKEQLKNAPDPNISSIGVQTIEYILKAWLDHSLNETIKNFVPDRH